MKRFILFIFIFVYLLPVQSAIITGEIEYNAEAVREAVFSEQPQPISFEFIRSHLIDCNINENANAIKLGITELSDRRVAKFSDDTYGIIYYNDPLYSWVYSSNGRLVNFTQKESLDYPCKFTKYKPDGSVANKGYKVSENESFIFNNQGKLIAHWDGNLCFDNSGNIIMTRKFIK